MTTVLADIGGTYARFGVLGLSGPDNLRKIEASKYSTLAQALGAYVPQGGKLRIATAARHDPVTGIWSFLNNNQWRVDPRELEAAGWTIEHIINDFAASAHGAVLSHPEILTVLRAGTPQAGQSCAILGPGTGLGLAFAIPLKAGGWHIQETFGGHMAAVLLTDEHRAIAHHMHGKNVIVPEDMVSGRGLPALYRAVCAEHGHDCAHTDAAMILAHAGDKAVVETLRLFHEFLGLFAHNAVVTGHAFGGVYLDGGIIQRLHGAGLYDAASFEKFLIPAVVPSVKAALENTPVWLVNDPYVALRGLAAI